jgi:hypothetical protein
LPEFRKDAGVTIDLADIVAATVVSVLGNGLLGNYLLGRYGAEQDRRLQRLKTDLDREVRRLQMSLDHTVLVHRVQFEAEFKAMQEIWSKVVELRGTMAPLRPAAAVVPAEQTPEQEEATLWTRFKDFSVALGAAKDAIFQNEPFISDLLYRELYENLLRAAQAEHTSIRLHPKVRTTDWYERGEKNLGDLVASATRVSTTIRARLLQLTVVPGE